MSGQNEPVRPGLADDRRGQGWTTTYPGQRRRGGTAHGAALRGWCVLLLGFCLEAEILKPGKASIGEENEP